MGQGKEAKIKIGGETEAAEQALKELENQGKKSLNNIKKSGDSTSNNVINSFKKLGIRSEAEIKKSTAASRKAFNDLKKSGVASANDIKRAHRQMTNKIKANNKELRGSNNKLNAGVSSLRTSVVGLFAGFAVAGAIKESTKFEDALLNLQKILKATDGDVDQFIDITNDLARQFGVSAAQVLEGATNFKLAGFSAEEAFLLQKDALGLAIAGQIDATEAAKLLVAILKGFKAPAIEAARVTDILNSVANNFATDVNELAIGMAQISPIASKMGLSFEETAGLLTPIIEVFRSGSEASKALRTGLLKLISDEKPVRDALAQLGIAQTETNGALRSGKDILLDVSSAFQNLDKNQQLFFTQQLVGLNQSARMAEVFAGLGQSAEVTEVSLSATGSVIKEVAIRTQAGSTQIDRMKVQFAEFARVLGDELIPLLPKILKFLVSIPKFALLAAQGVAVLLLQIAKVTDFFKITKDGVQIVTLAIVDLEKKISNQQDKIDSLDFSTKRLDSTMNRFANTTSTNIDKINIFGDSLGIASNETDILNKANMDLTKTTEDLAKIEKEASKQRIDNLKIFNQSLQTSISGLRTQLGKLRSEAEASATFTQTLQNRIEAFDREQAAKGKGERGRLKLGVEFATEDFERAKQELAAGNRQAAEDLANAAFAGFEEAAGRSEVLGGAQAAQARAMLDEIVAFSSEITAQVESQATQVQTNLQELQSVAQRIEAKIKIEVDAKDAFETISKLKQPTTSQHTIFVNTVETKQAGGQVGAIRARTGRHLPGFGGGDKIPVLAEAGEFVLRKEAVKTFGVDVISAINRMDISGLNKKLNGVNIQKFQQGGQVQASPASNVNVNLKLAGENFKLQASKEIADNFVNKINQTNILLGRYQTPY